MKVLFLGYQSIGRAGLEYLVRENFPLAAVVTHQDHPGEKIWWKPLAELAPVKYFEDLGLVGLEKLVAETRPDILLSFYFRKMVPLRILHSIPRGGLNMHGSYLPKYRGRAPANWVLVNGESETGMTLHEMVAQPDAGPIVDQERVPIGPRETIATLYPKLVEATRTILRRTWPLVVQGREQRVPQDESLATYFGGRRPEDGRIQWEWPARRVDCLVRAVTKPYPGAFAAVNGKIVRVWQGRLREGSGRPGVLLDRERFIVACGEKAYEIELGEFDGTPEAAGPELRALVSGSAI